MLPRIKREKIKKILGFFNYVNYFGPLITAIINPPINPRFINTARWWKGNKWKIIVVGIRNSNKKTEPIFCFSLNIKNPEPEIRHIMAPTRRIDEIGSGMPFEEIYSTVLSKSFILPGMAEINIAEIDTLEKKSKKDLILLFFIKEFS